MGNISNLYDNVRTHPSVAPWETVGRHRIESIQKGVRGENGRDDGRGPGSVRRTNNRTCPFPSKAHGSKKPPNSRVLGPPPGRDLRTLHTAHKNETYLFPKSSGLGTFATVWDNNQSRSPQWKGVLNRSVGNNTQKHFLPNKKNKILFLQFVRPNAKPGGKYSLPLRKPFLGGGGASGEQKMTHKNRDIKQLKTVHLSLQFWNTVTPCLLGSGGPRNNPPAPPRRLTFAPACNRVSQTARRSAPRCTHAGASLPINLQHPLHLI